MAAIIDFMSGRQRLQRRTDWALAPRSAAEEPPTLVATREPRGLRARAVGQPKTVAAPLFFNVRSFACGEHAHTLQFGFVDESANVVFSVFAKSPSAAPPAAADARSGLAVEPLDPEALRRLLVSVCRGADLIGFHRVLQGGLLPLAAVDASTSLHCVWRRLQNAAKAHGLCKASERPMTLNDALLLAGMRPLDSDDAVMRALAIRELWLWLDKLG